MDPEETQTPETPTSPQSEPDRRRKRTLIVAGAVAAVAAVALVVSLLIPTGEEANPPPEDPTPVEVPVDPEPDPDVTEQPAPETPAEESPETPGAEADPTEEEPDDVTDPEDADEPKPEDFPPGSPEDRGGLPEEFPLVDSFTPVGTEQTEWRDVLLATVDDATEAVTVLDYNLLQHYRVSQRNADPDRRHAGYIIEGPGAPEGTRVSVTIDGDMRIEFPRD